MTSHLVCSLLLLIAATSTYAAGIQGGVPTTIKKHPSLVSVQLIDGTRICGGTLIDENTVVTAATCLTFYDADQLVVGVNNGAKVVKISKKKFKGDFDPVTMENDVAVLKLAERVNAHFPKLASQEPATGASGVVTGWAANNAVVDIAETIISAEDCVSGKYNYEEGEVLDTMLCGLAKNGKACNALPGSPLVSNNKLVGLVSWGYACGNEGNPAVFTDIASVRSWIQETSKNL